MQWEFRKILDSIESYRAGSHRFIGEIEKGTPGSLNTIVREIELIMTDLSAKIISKVLAMRVNKSDYAVCKRHYDPRKARCHKLAFQISASHAQNDPNRGQSFFFDHPQYHNASPQQRQEIQRLGSTYFTLNLESIYHWGKWIPADQQGNQSIFSKGLNTLLERGVKFNNTYNYYKNSDTQKFKNTYKIQFFSQQSVDLDSNIGSSRAISEKGSHVSSYQNINCAQNILNALYNLQYSNTKRFDKLQQLNKFAVSLLQKKYPPHMVYYGKQKNQRKWLQNYIVNHNLLSDNKISYEEFIRRSCAQPIQIPQKIESQVNQSNGFKKVKTANKRQIIKSNSSQIRQNYQEAMKRQQMEHRTQKQQLRYDIESLNLKLEQQRTQYETQKNRIMQDYEDRIKLMKRQAGNEQFGKKQPLIKENQSLKQRLYDLQRSLMASRSREIQTNNLAAAYEQLKLQNQYLKRPNQANQKNDEINNNLLFRVKQLEKLVQAYKNEKEGYSKQYAQLQQNKKAKQNQNILDQLNLYKSSLKNERQDFDRKYKQLQNKLQQVQAQNRNLKQRNKSLQRRLDLRQIQAIQLNQHVKLLKDINKNAYVSINKQGNSKSSSNQGKTEDINFIGTSSDKNYFSRTLKPTTAYDFKKYQNLKNQYFKNDKQRYLRFCRCSLKKKDLLLKQNELQIGLISQAISNEEVKFIIHITNLSEVQINEIRLNCESIYPNQYQIVVETEYIFCLQSKQQEKANILCRSINFFMNESYNPIFLNISYIKNGKIQQTRAIIPFVLLKTMEFYKVDATLYLDRNQQVTISFPYSQKMIPNPKQLLIYFPHLQQTSNNKYQCDMLHRESGTQLRLAFMFKQDNRLGVIISFLGPDGKNERIREALLNDLMGFIEFCFRREIKDAVTYKSINEK